MLNPRKMSGGKKKDVSIVPRKGSGKDVSQNKIMRNGAENLHGTGKAGKA